MSDPLHCSICKAPATVHLTQIAHGKIHKVHLCEACAAKGGVTEAPILNLMEILGGATPATPAARATVAGAVCRECGMTEAEFTKTARLGCARCYEVFADNIAELLPRIQSGTTHSGKFPAGARLDALRALLETKNAGLAAAIAAEDYERAAKLRDEVASLSAKITGGA